MQLCYLNIVKGNLKDKNKIFVISAELKLAKITKKQHGLCSVTFLFVLACVSKVVYIILGCQ